jgi:hypothetical protein
MWAYWEGRWPDPCVDVDTHYQYVEDAGDVKPAVSEPKRHSDVRAIHGGHVGSTFSNGDCVLGRTSSVLNALIQCIARRVSPFPEGGGLTDKVR